MQGREQQQQPQMAQPLRRAHTNKPAKRQHNKQQKRNDSDGKMQQIESLCSVSGFTFFIRRSLYHRIQQKSQLYNVYSGFVYAIRGSLN